MLLSLALGTNYLFFAGVLAGLASFLAGVLAGFALLFDVVVEFDIVVLVVVVVLLAFDVVVVFDALDVLVVFVLVVLFVPVSPHAMPKAPITRTAESAITFFILFKRLLSTQRLNYYSKFRLIRHSRFARNSFLFSAIVSIVSGNRIVNPKMTKNQFFFKKFFLATVGMSSRAIVNNKISVTLNYFLT